MEAGRDVIFRGVGISVSILVLFLVFVTFALGAGPKLHMQIDELSCGDVRVRAFTTCTKETGGPIPDCTEQHFLFSNQRTGISVRIPASGRLILPDSDEPKETMKILNGVAASWACVRGKAGPYVIMNYYTGGTCETCEWSEVFDANGRRLLTDKSDKDPTDKEVKRFNKKWDSLGLPNPWPWNSFTLIKLQDTDK
jgi:hypothetical protein